MSAPDKIQINAASRLITASAEQAIRDAINAVPHQSIGKPFPVVTHFNGTTVPFMAHITRIANSAEQMRGNYSKVDLLTVKWGLLVKGHPKCWIAMHYVLDQKNRLKEGGLPKQLDEQEAHEFFHKCGLPIPAHGE
jgi:hypothetical protein